MKILNSKRMMQRASSRGLVAGLVGLTFVMFVMAGGGSAAAFWPAKVKKQVPVSRANVQLSYAPVVKKAAPAVVNVYVRHQQVVRRRSPFMDDPFFRFFFGDRGFGLPRRRIENSLGSGVIVAPDGIVVTNYHVIKGSGRADIKVALADKREFPARVMLTDKKSDLAVLRIEAPRLSFPYLDFADSDALEVGDLVLAIGNPFGVGQTVTSGIISALARTRVGKSDYQAFIQTDAAINPGNSGGALVDMQGRLVGVNTAIFSKSGGSHGIGFAIPSNLVRVVVRSALQGVKEVRRPWLGARLVRVSSDIAESLGLDRALGALVEEVFAGSPAERAGLRSGDVIVAFDGREISDQRAFQYRLTTKGIGGYAVIGIIRDGRRQSLRLPLQAAPEIPPRDIRVLQGPHPFEGAEVGNLSPALAEELSIEEYHGVVVLRAPHGTMARSIGLRPGDILLKINGQPVLRTRQLERLLRYPQRRWRFSIRRNGQILSTVISG